MADADSMPVSRACTKCSEIKPMSAFSKATGGKYGLSARCRVCAGKYAKENRERISAMSLARYHRLQEPIRQGKHEAKFALLSCAEKMCSGCGFRKPKDEFKKHKSAADGLHCYCRECNNRRNREYRIANPDKAAAWAKKWSSANLDKVRAKYKRWAKQPQNRIHLAVTARVSQTLRSGGKSKKTEQLIGYKFSELKKHLERQFTPGMSWDNYGDWHVDHIVPLSSFLISSQDDPMIRIAWCLSNLRPLWAGENLKKSAQRIYLI